MWDLTQHFIQWPIKQIITLLGGSGFNYIWIQVWSINPYTGKCAGTSRPSCWWAAARAGPWRTASPCLPRHTLTGPRSPPHLETSHTSASEPGCETSHLTYGTGPPATPQTEFPDCNQSELKLSCDQQAGIARLAPQGSRLPHRQCVTGKSGLIMGLTRPSFFRWVCEKNEENRAVSVSFAWLQKHPRNSNMGCLFYAT